MAAGAVPDMSNPFVYSHILHVKAAGDTPAEAQAKANKKLVKAAKQVANGKSVTVIGADYRGFDPGGGGGPCAPLRTQDFDVSTSGLLIDAKPR